jgi:hypothetical protein
MKIINGKGESSEHIAITSKLTVTIDSDKTHQVEIHFNPNPVMRFSLTGSREIAIEGIESEGFSVLVDGDYTGDLEVVAE